MPLCLMVRKEKARPITPKNVPIALSNWAVTWKLNREEVREKKS